MKSSIQIVGPWVYIIALFLIIGAAALITLGNLQTGWLAVDFALLPTQKPITEALTPAS